MLSVNLAEKSTRRSGWQSKWLVGLLAWFVLMPIVGLGLAHFQPLGLFESPKVGWSRLGLLFCKTIALAGTVSIFAVSMGTWLAVVNGRHRFFGRRVFGLLALAPLAIPSYVLAAILREAMAPRGALGNFLGRTDAFTGFWAAVLVLTIACAPYAYLLVSATLARCPVQEEQAARGLGAGDWDVFRFILLPRLRGPIMYSVLLITLYVVSDFGAVSVLDCDVLTWVLYAQRNSSSAFEVGFLLLFAVAPIIVGIRWLRSEETGEFGVDFMSLQRTNLGGVGSTVTYFCYSVLIGLGAIFPVGMLISWICEGLEQSVPFADVFNAISTTGGYALVGGLLTLVIATWVCWVISRTASHRAMLDVLVYLPSSLPGVLIAVGLLQLVLALKRSGFDWISGLESTGVVLLIAYAMRFLAQAYAALRPGFNRIDPQVEQAAKSLGADDWTIWRYVRIPSLAPSMAVAFALTFLSIGKELPITLTLVPLQQRTLAYHIFDAQAEGALPDVGLASLCLLGMILLMQVMTQYWRRAYG
jgi:iron(III) transport system permease protein